MTPSGATPLAAVRSMVANRRLLLNLIRRDIATRYRGSAGGLLWSIIHPLLLLAVYSFVFSVVFGARWTQSGQPAGKAEFAIIVFVGMTVHALLAECINRAPALIPSNVNLVKRVVFPLELLPAVTLGSALFHLAVSLGIVLLAQSLVGSPLRIQILWLPVILLPLCLLCLGLAWLLSALGVYVRDIAQVSTLATTVLMFLSPVFYPPTALPEPYRHLLSLNPLTFVIEQARAVALFGSPPDLAGLGLYFLIAAAVFSAGYWIFQRLRPGFADVL